MDYVFFDLDDTLYDQAQPFAFAYRKVFGTRFDTAGPGASPLDVEALFSASRRHSEAVFLASERGEMSMEDMYVYRIQKAFEDFGISVSADECLRMQAIYAASQESAIEVSPTMARVLDWCRENSHPGIISNGPAEHQLKKIEALRLDRWVSPEETFISSIVGVAKPDPAIFYLACERCGTSPKRCLYVGDSFKPDVGGAAAAGMPVVWFNRRHRDEPDGQGDPVPNWIVESEKELLGLLPTLA
ncbi:MAG: HAD family hydrolase [Tractidigestivibacter sp.]|jgi:HAD superfamily hydrolase (TIGR01549 family)|uniref:HAD family hydrolase n=1 Tax=Tractidigestivibacter sp. TaxID=2847320 RepID=UPI003D8F7114